MAERYKHFALDFEKDREMKVERDMLSDPKFKRVTELKNTCVQNASKVNGKRITDLLEEDNDALYKSGLKFDQALRKLVNKDCKNILKLFGDMNRFRAAEVKHEHYFKHDMRTLANNGVKFHPYL